MLAHTYAIRLEKFLNHQNCQDLAVKLTTLAAEANANLEAPPPIEVRTARMLIQAAEKLLREGKVSAAKIILEATELMLKPRG